MKNICIIGSGSWGCALAIHAAKMGHNVKIWSFAQEEANLINKERKCMFFANGNDTRKYILHNRHKKKQ